MTDLLVLASVQTEGSSTPHDPGGLLAAVLETIRQALGVSGAALLAVQKQRLVPVAQDGLRVKAQALDGQCASLNGHSSSCQAYPLIVDGVLEGELLVGGSDQWTSDSNLLPGLLSLAGNALRTLRLAADDRQAAASARRREDEFRALAELARAAGGMLDPVAVATLAVEHTLQLLGTDAAFLWVHDAETDRLRCLAHRDSGRLPSMLTANRTIGSAVLGRTFRRARALVVTDYRRWRHADPEIAAEGVVSVLAVPLLIDNRAIGVLVTHSYARRRFPADEVQLLTLLAAEVAPAVETARLHEQSERRRAEAEALAELAKAAAAAPQTEHVTDLVTKQACALIRADFAAVVLVEEGRTVTIGISGNVSDSWRSIRKTPPGGSLARAIATRRSVIAERIGEDPEFSIEDLPLQRAEGGRTSLTVPLFVGSKILGALILGWRSDVSIASEQLRLAEALAGYAATVVENARSHAREEARAGELAAVIEHIPSGVIVVNSSGRLVLMNESGRRITGDFPDSSLPLPSQAAGQQLRDPRTGELITDERTPLARALRGEHVSGVVLAFTRGDTGAQLWVTISSAPLRDRDGNVTGAISVFSDVTKERHMAQALASQEERLRRLYDTMACGVIITDSAGMTYMNRAAREMLGFGESGAVREVEWHAIREDGTRLRTRDLPGAVALRGIEYRNHIIGLFRPDGELRWFQGDAVPMIGADGKVDQAVISFIDVTERKRTEEALRESEDRYRDLVENSWDMFATHDLDGAILTFNVAGANALGYSPEALAGMNIKDLIAPEFRHEFSAYIEQVRTTGAAGGFMRVVSRSGEQRIWEYRDTLRTQGVATPIVRCTARDVTEGKQAEKALRRSEARFRVLTERISDIIVIVDSEGTIQYLSPAVERVLGYQPQLLQGKPVFKYVHAEDLALILRAFEEIAGSPGASRFLTFRLRHRENTWRYVEGTISNLVNDPSVAGIVGNFRDVTDRRQVEEALVHQALHDSLTELPNRALLQDRLRQAILTAHRDQARMGLMLLDLDHFKEINDTFGHHYGDLLLCQIGPRLRGVLRQSDTVARLGGDEFAIVLPAVGDVSRAVSIAEKVANVLKPAFTIEQQALEVGASIGIVLYPEHGEDAETLMRHADIAMYRAKRQRDGYAIYGDEEDAATPGRLVLTTELREAVEQDQLELFYQPKIELRTGKLAGVEALVRWRHPARGLVLPDDFVPLAEQTTIIKPLSHWVINAALRQCREWHRAGHDISVAVNLSMQNLRDPQLPSTIGALLQDWQAPMGWLKVEITESIIMADPVKTMDVVTRLHDMGVTFCIDDFGTGYSSMAYLKKLPAQEIKIDKSFVMDILTDENDAVIVRSVIDLAHNLGRLVVAEGVETAEVLSVLKELGCDVAQGHYFGRPMPAAEFQKWLAAHQ